MLTVLTSSNVTDHSTGGRKRSETTVSVRRVGRPTITSDLCYTRAVSDPTEDEGGRMRGFVQIQSWKALSNRSDGVNRMRNCVACVLVCVIGALPAIAQAPAYRAPRLNGHPDLNGVW